MSAPAWTCRMCRGTHWIVMYGGPGNTLKAPCLECNMDGKKPERPITERGER